MGDLDSSVLMQSQPISAELHNIRSRQSGHETVRRCVSHSSEAVTDVLSVNLHLVRSPRGGSGRDGKLPVHPTLPSPTRFTKYSQPRRRVCTVALRINFLHRSEVSPSSTRDTVPCLSMLLRYFCPTAVPMVHRAGDLLPIFHQGNIPGR